jgi:hypothetical protein
MREPFVVWRQRKTEVVIDPQASKLFISGYSALLTEVHRISNGKSGMKRLDMLAGARDAAVADSSLFEMAALSLEAAGLAVPEEVLDAVQSLNLQYWVFLRDTTKYSIFIDVGGEEAYAVLGLTQRISDIVGGTGIFLRTGVIKFRGSYICDGLITKKVWLGANYKREYSDKLASIKKSGRFHTG